MITLAQPSLALNSFGVKSHYAFSMWRTWNMPQSATSKDVVYWIGIDDFEGRVYQFNADGSYWQINPNGGTFLGPPTIYGSQG